VLCALLMLSMLPLHHDSDITTAPMKYLSLSLSFCDLVLLISVDKPPSYLCRWDGS